VAVRSPIGRADGRAIGARGVQHAAALVRPLGDPVGMADGAAVPAALRSADCSADCTAHRAADRGADRAPVRSADCTADDAAALAAAERVALGLRIRPVDCSAEPTATAERHVDGAADRCQHLCRRRQCGRDAKCRPDVAAVPPVLQSANAAGSDPAGSLQHAAAVVLSVGGLVQRSDAVAVCPSDPARLAYVHTSAV
jgi:hypothetical protein